MTVVPGVSAGAALLTAMIIVTLIASLAAGMVWQQYRAVQIEAADRARAQSTWILQGALDWARLILKRGRPQQPPEARRPPRRALGRAAGRVAAVHLPGGRPQRRPATTRDPEAFLSGTIDDAQSRYNLRALVGGTKVTRAGAARAGAAVQPGQRATRHGRRHHQRACARPSRQPASGASHRVAVGGAGQWRHGHQRERPAAARRPRPAHLAGPGRRHAWQAPAALRRAAAQAHAGQPEHGAARSHRRAVRRRRPRLGRARRAGPQGQAAAEHRRRGVLLCRPTSGGHRRPRVGQTPPFSSSPAGCGWTSGSWSSVR